MFFKFRDAGRNNCANCNFRAFRIFVVVFHTQFPFMFSQALYVNLFTGLAKFASPNLIPMKTTFITLLSLVFILPLFAQKQFEFMNQQFEFIAERNGQPVRLETKDFGLSINYETGAFFAKINLTEARLYSDEEVEYRIPGDAYLEISGNIPINQIFDNNSQKQKLTVELNVKHLDSNVPSVFDFNLTRLKNASRGFTMFNIIGAVNLLDFGVKDLKGYQPEVEIVLGFQAVLVGG